MVVAMQCIEKNLPALIRTPHQFGRVIEHMIFSLRNGAKPGDSNKDDPNIVILAQVVPKLKAEYVTSSNSFNSIRCYIVAFS